MEPLGEDIRSELRRMGGESGPGDVAADWIAAVGEEIARNAWPARTQADGTLVVHVRDAVWGFELTQRAGEISARLPGRPQLRFVPGELPENAPSAVAPASPEPTLEHARVASRLTASIEDRTLREAVAKAIKMSLARDSHDRPV
jgi:hypothetical protein